VGVLTICFAATACNRTAPEITHTRPLRVIPPIPIDPWILTTLDAEDPTPALLWNGLIGLRLGRDATTKGQPFFSIDEFDTTGEEKINVLSCPLPYGFRVNGSLLPITDSYRQTLDMRTGELDTKWRSGALSVDCITVMHPGKKMIAQRWSLDGVTPQQSVDFDLGKYGKMGPVDLVAHSFIIGNPGMSSKFMAYKPDPKKNVVEFVISMGKSLNFPKMMGVRGVPFKATKNWQLPPLLEEFPKVESSSRAVWASRWKTDIEIDGPVEDQQALRSFLFYLRSAIHPDGEMSIGPFGISNNKFNGHVFWDSDTWIYPTLAFIDPAEASRILAYRLSTMKTASQNFRDWILQGRPMYIGKMGVFPGSTLMPGIKYPWESSVTGRETIPSRTRFEDHVTGDVFRCFDQARMLGLDQGGYDAIARGALGFFTNRITKDPDGLYSLNMTVSPAEDQSGNNDLYTNLVVQSVFDKVLAGVTAYQKPKLRLPHDSKSFLTLDDDRVASYNQAAAILSIFPLQYAPAEQQEKVMMDRFVGKVIPNGPAMTDSINAVIWARFGEAAKAYKAWRTSWKDFTKAPLMLFSEKKLRPETYFTTGAAGSLQTVLFGFMGFRLDSQKEQDSAWSKQLQGGNWLSVKPNIPREWKSVKFRNFTVLGRKYTLTATHRPTGADAIQVIQGD